MNVPKITNITILWIVFFVVLIVHMQNKVMTSGDSRWFIPVAVSILEEGDIALNEYAGRIEAEQHYGIQQVDGKYYSIFPIGTALISLPFVWALDWFFDETLDITLAERLKTERLERVERFIASIFAALASVFIYLVASRLLNGFWGPLLVAFIFAFASPVWSTASRALWQHGPSVLLLSVALFLIVCSKERPAALLALGPMLAFAYIVRPTNAFSFVLLLIPVFRRSQKRFVWTVLLSLLVFVPFVAFNRHVFGTLLTPYYQPGRLGFESTFLEALAGNLYSPNRGLLIFSPIFLCSLYGVYLKVRRRTFSLFDAALGAIIVLHWVAISSFPHWWGGFCIGPRFFTDMIPYLTYFVIPVIPEIQLDKKRLRIPRLLFASLFSLLLVMSFYTHKRSANSLRVPLWNLTPVSVDEFPSRVWDWGDLQFLRRPGKAVPDYSVGQEQRGK